MEAKYKKPLLITFILVLISPLFGVIGAELVGYHEPLDLAAEKLGLSDITDQLNWTPLLDYTVPGLPDVVGYIISGLVGVAIILLIGIMVSRSIRK